MDGGRVVALGRSRAGLRGGGRKPNEILKVSRKVM